MKVVLLFSYWIVGLAYPILDTSDNLAEGEIIKMNYVESCKNKHKIGDRVVGTKDGYEWIWVHVGNDYFKVIGKWTESPWTCQ